MQRSIYLDNAATTPMAPEVANAMEPFLLDQFGNPSTFYEYGEMAKNADPFLALLEGDAPKA